MDGSLLSSNYRWLVAGRLLLAFVGGFVWISTFGALMSQLLVAIGWMTQPQAVHVMTLAGYLLWVALAMWVFYHPRLATVSAWVVTSALGFYLLSIGLMWL